MVALDISSSLVGHVDRRAVHSSANAVRVFLDSHILSIAFFPRPSVPAMFFLAVMTFLMAALPGLGHVEDDEEHQQESDFSDHL